MLADRIARPFVVAAVGEDELHLVRRTQLVDVRPVVVRGLAAGRALQVDDSPHPRIDTRDVEPAAGFEQDGESAVAEAAHQGMNAGLEQGFAAGDFHQRAVERQHLGDHVVCAHPRAFVEAVLGVAPTAPHLAPGQPHQDARAAREGRFALDRVEDLVDLEPLALGQRGDRVELAEWIRRRRQGAAAARTAGCPRGGSTRPPAGCPGAPAPGTSSRRSRRSLAR